MRKIILTAIIGVVCILGLKAKNTALLIGIGDYNPEATGWNPIHGNNDVELLKGKLQSKGFEVYTLKDSQATKQNVTNALDNLVSTTGKGDIVYLHFSGHGQLVEDYNNDEQDEYDQSFICYDACFSPQYTIGSQNYRGQNHLVDDELFPYLNNLKKKVGKNGEVVVIFDSCYSGGADRGDMDDDPEEDSPVEWSKTTRGSNDEFRANRRAEDYLRKINKPGEYSTGGGEILVVSACESDKKNYECKDKHSGQFYGSLSYCVSKLLDKNVPMDQWEYYFSNKKYKEDKIFRPTQHPVVESHK